MDDTRNVSQNRQEDVDEEVSSAAALKEDTDGRKEDGEDDFDDVAAACQCIFLVREPPRWCYHLVLCRHTSR